MSDIDRANVQAAALCALESGLSPLPAMEDGSKRPDLSSWAEFQERKPTMAEMNRWYSKGRAGLMLVTGAISGNLEVLDFDCHATYIAFVEAAEQLGLGDLIRRIASGYSEQTPDRGVHWPYRCTEIGGSIKLAERPNAPGAHGRPTRETLIEVKGEGGCVIVAPTFGAVHPTGRPYSLLAGSFATIATITPPEREVLRRLARSFDAIPPPLPASSARQYAAAVSDGQRPGDIYAARHSWDDILIPHGWTNVATIGTKTLWRRPGKAEGLSATTNYADSGLLYVFSSSTEFEPWHGYGKFSAYTLLNHNGDFAAAARELAARGYGSTAPSTLRAVASAEIPASLEEKPLPFPVSAFPVVTRRFIKEAAASVDCPPDFIGAPLLAFAAACIGGTRCLELKPGYREFPILYIATVGSPSSGKTPAMNLSREGVKRLQDEAYQQYKLALVTYEQETAAYRQADPSDRKGAPVKPTLEHFFTEDSTTEALGAMLANSPGLVYAPDELITWAKAMDAYRSGRGGDRQRWLVNWSARTWKIDRKGAEPVYIQRPAVSVAGGAQPDVLCELRHEAGAQDGFIDRLLWAFPVAGTPGWTEEIVSAETLAAYCAQFSTLRARRDDDEPAVIHLSAEAKMRYIDWRGANTARVEEVSGLLAGIYGKLPAQLARLALVLHCLCRGREAEHAPVDLETMEGAIALVEYFRSHAHRILPLFGQAPPLRVPFSERVLAQLKSVGDWIARSELRDLFHRNVTAQELGDALAQLEQQGRAERRSNRTSGSGRPPEEWRAQLVP